jgi:hypothetical protein
MKKEIPFKSMVTLRELVKILHMTKGEFNTIMRNYPDLPYIRLDGVMGTRFVTEEVIDFLQAKTKEQLINTLKYGKKSRKRTKAEILFIEEYHDKIAEEAAKKELDSRT